MSKIAEAITKIAVDCKESGFERVIGTYLQGIINNDEIADLILVEGKNLKRCCDEITQKAQKMKSGNCAVVEDNEVFGWAREYYGVNELMLSEKNKKAEPKPIKSVSIFDFL